MEKRLLFILAVLLTSSVMAQVNKIPADTRLYLQQLQTSNKKAPGIDGTVKQREAKLFVSCAPDADIKAIAKDAIRQQFAQYGMSNVPDEVLENYADEQLKKRENIDGFVDRAVDQKLVEKLKTVVKLTKKSVSLADFNKLMQEK